MRYVDDVLSFVPIETNLTSLLQELNGVDPMIQFTVEEENSGQIPFLDTLVITTGTRLKFTVYRKSTNKNDIIHYFSAHSKRVKSGVVIGFFLRAYRICSDDLLQDEIDRIIAIFTKLKYPLAELISFREKARKIMARPRRADSQPRAKKQTHLVIAPHSTFSEPVRALLSPFLSIVTTGAKSGENA